MQFPLPDELAGLIFNHLDVPSLLRCMQVCKLFYSVVLGSTQLAYKIELFASCMVDNEHSSMDTVSRLNVLREHNRVWNNMKWPSYGSVPMCNGSCWEFSGGILAQSTRQNGIFLVQLPCKLKSIAERRWSIPFDFNICDFTLDNSQDLIVLIEMVGAFPDNSYILHLRTLSGEHHPRTTMSRITYAPGNSHANFLSFVIQICGNRLAVLFHDRLDCQSSFLVWNWHTGHKEMHIHTPEFESFAFMTDDLILAAVLKSDKEPTLQVLRITGRISPIHSLEDIPYICELQYPVLKGNAEYFSIRSASPVSGITTDSGVPFYCSRKDFIFTITMTIRSESDEMDEWIVLVVPLSILLSEVERSHNMPRRSVAWDTWGPSGTRMISRRPSTTWVCYTYGMRFIQGPQLDNGRLACTYDFNPYAAKMHVETSRGADSPTSWKSLTKQSKPNPWCKGFDREVTTTLPGQVATVTLHYSEEGWKAAMIGENHILMVQPESSTYGYMAM